MLILCRCDGRCATLGLDVNHGGLIWGMRWLDSTIGAAVWVLHAARILPDGRAAPLDTRL